MSDERTGRNAEDIFNAAAEIIDPNAREAFLAAECGDDDDLRTAVESLLQHDRDAGSFLEKSPREIDALLPTRDSGDLENAATGSDDSWLELLETSPRTDALGRLGSYDILELVGRGGMGVVLRAFDPKLNRVVAIKLLAPELAAQATAVQRFLREARAAAAVSHDHVVSIYAIDDEARPPRIVMEMIDGQSLQQKIDSTGSMDVRSILRIGMQTAAGLAAAHRQGLVHRDIKPANILLENGIEKVKLTDFGLARAVDDIGMTKTGQITGTPQYMSPEQAQGQRVDHRTDLFSLGCVLYAMCTGRAAFRADSAVAVLHRIVHDTPRPIREFNEDIPDWLCAIVDRLIVKNSEERFESAEAVEELLGRYLAHLQQPDSVPMPASPQPKAAAHQTEPDVPMPLRFCGALLFLLGVVGAALGGVVISMAMAGWIGAGKPPGTSNMLFYVGMITLGILVGTGAASVFTSRNYQRAMLGTIISFPLALMMKLDDQASVLALFGFIPGAVAIYYLLKPETRFLFDLRDKNSSPTDSGEARFGQLVTDLAASGSRAELSDEVEQQLKFVRNVLGIFGIMSLLWFFVCLFMPYHGSSGFGFTMPTLLLSLMTGGLALNGAWHAMHRRSYGWTVIGSIALLFPVNLPQIGGLVFSVLSAIKLWRDDVRFSFDSERDRVAAPGADDTRAESQRLLRLVPIPVWIAILLFGMVYIAALVELSGEDAISSRGNGFVFYLLGVAVVVLWGGGMLLSRLLRGRWPASLEQFPRPGTIFVLLASLMIGTSFFVWHWAELKDPQERDNLHAFFFGYGSITLELPGADVEVTFNGRRVEVPADGVVSLPVYQPGSYVYSVENGDGSRLGGEFLIAAGARVGSGVLTEAVTVDVTGPVRGSVGRQPGESGADIGRGGPSGDSMVSTGLRIPAEPPAVELDQTWKINDWPILDVDISGNGKWLASVHRSPDEHQVWIWPLDEITRNNRRWFPKVAGGEVRDLTISPDNTRVAWVEADGWLRTSEPSEDGGKAIEFQQAPVALHCVAWSATSQWIATGGDRMLTFWDANVGGAPLFSVPIPGASEGRITGLVWEPRGKRIAAGTDSGRVVVWEVLKSDVRLEREFTSGPAGAVRSLTWSADRNWIVAGFQRGSLEAFSLTESRQPGTGQSVGARRAVAFSPDSRWLASAGESAGNRHAISLDGLTQQPMAERHSLHDAHSKPVTGLVFTPNGRHLISASEDGTIKWWKFAEPLAVAQFRQDVAIPKTPPFVRLADTWGETSVELPVSSLDVSQSGEFLVVGRKHSIGRAATVSVLDVAGSLESGGDSQIGIVQMPDNVGVTQVSVSPDDRFFAWTRSDGKLGRQRADFSDLEADSFLPVEDTLYCLDWSPDGKRIVTGGTGKLYFWDAAAEWKNHPKSVPMLVVDAHDGKDVRSVAWSPDGKWITTGSSDGKVWWWDPAQEKPTGQFRNDSGEQFSGQIRGVTSMEWSQDSRKIVFGLENGQFRVLHADGQRSSKISGEGQPSVVAWSPDGLWIASGNSTDETTSIRIEHDRSIPEEQRPSSELAFEFIRKSDGLHMERITALRFTSDGRYLISGSEDGTVKWWKFAEPLARE